MLLYLKALALDIMMRGKVGVLGSLLALQDMYWDDNEWCGMEL